MKLSLYNTLTKSVSPFTPVSGRLVRMYSCGPTVYDVAHIGNMRAFIVADLIQRTLRAIGGYDVQWVMNITDIDDKIIRDSTPGSNRWRAEMGEASSDAHANLKAFTKFYEAEFVADIESVGIQREHFFAMPRATEYIAQMQELIRSIVDAGVAYVSDGSVYFDVAKYSANNEYGRLFHIDKENFRQGVRIDADEYDRESVSDFALWKACKPNEPFWDFDLNGVNLPGRPGWHIECSAMSHDLLGLPIDIHTGGVDLRFPHHEDELAQCCAGYHVREQSTFWMHNEHLDVEGKKMSKSLGNFYTLRDLLDKGIDPLDFRLAMLSAHYRSKMNFTFDGLAAASTQRKRIQEYIWDLVALASENGGASENGVATESNDVLSHAFDALADDLHTPRALAELNTAINNTPVRSLTPESAAALLRSISVINDVFAVWNFEARPVLVIPDEIQQIANDRWSARTSKQWDESDRLRAVLKDRGWEMLDGKDSFELQPL